MADKQISFDQLAQKGFHVSVPTVDEATWNRLVAEDPSIPQTFSRTRSYGQLLYGTQRRTLPRMVSEFPSRGSLRSLYEECGEAAWQRLFTALRNPHLSQAQRDEIEVELDATMPTFEQSTETAHFILRWTNASANATDNIDDAAIIKETGGFLEDAWQRYQHAFGRTPYCPSGKTKIEVVFYDIPGAHGVASPPDGPIQLNSNSWLTTPGLRRSVSAHELFHKLQYAFGFRTVWNPPSPYKWYSEGTCSWAEVFVCQRVSSAGKITQMFTDPDLNLFDASYSALPFWVFFEARQKSSTVDNPMLHFLTTCEPAGKLFDALRQVVDEEWPPNSVYGELATFYALFARERRLGAWTSGPLGNLYPSILGPTGTPIKPTLSITKVPLGLSDTYTVGAQVSQLGSDYYRFAFEPDAEGETFAFSVSGAPGGNYSYYLLWEKNNVWKRASFPFGVSGSYSYSEVVKLIDANALLLVISGRGTGGAYTLNASIT